MKTKPQPNVHQAILSSGLVIGHIGSKAMTMNFPDRALRLELDDIRLLIDLLKRCGVNLKDNVEHSR